MDKLYILQSRFGKIDESGWLDLEIISVDAGTQFTSMELQKEYQKLRSSFDVTGYGTS